MSKAKGSIADFLMRSVASVEEVVDVRWRRLKDRLGWDGVPRIVPYTGYANQTHAWFHGRVLSNPPRGVPADDDGWWDNLAAMYRRLESDEVPGVDVAIDFAGGRHVVTSDEEGYFRLQAARHAGPPHALWAAAALRIVGHPRVSEGESLTTAKLMTPDPRAAFGVISDIDDTVIQTDVVNILAMARHTFFGSARTRKPLAGAAGLYRALQAGPEGAADAGRPRNPVWYVSSSPWNLHDLLEDFLDLNALPPGPLLLRDLGLGGESHLIGGHGHKLDKTLRIMDAFAAMPFVLIGDSGQEDAALYASAAEQRPGRVRAIFIRDVDPDLRSHRDDAVGAAASRADAAGTRLHLVADSRQAAEIAAAEGLIAADAVAAIAADASRDLAAG